jgi:hypothetical protein
MVWPLPHGETVTLLRAGESPGRDAAGIPIPGGVDEIPVPQCVVTPREELPAPGGPQQQGRDTVIKGWTVYAPPGTVVLTTDRVRIRGTVFDVTGEAGDWGRSPFTGVRGPVQFSADRITG